MKPKYHFRFTRRQVENLEMDVLLEAFDPHVIAAPALRGFCGAVEIHFDGYHDFPMHPVVIPELRGFLRTLAQRWGPHSVPFFCDATSPFTLLYATAQLDHLLVIERDETEDFFLVHKRGEVAELRRTAFVGIHQLGQRAGLSKTTIRRRQKQFSTLLDIALCFEFRE